MPEDPRSDIVSFMHGKCRSRTKAIQMMQPPPPPPPTPPQPHLEAPHVARQHLECTEVLFRAWVCETVHAEAVPWNERAQMPRPKPSVRRVLFQEGEHARQDKTRPEPVQPVSKGVITEDDKLLIEQFIRDGADAELVQDLLRRATEHFAQAMLSCSCVCEIFFVCVIVYACMHYIVRPFHMIGAPGACREEDPRLQGQLLYAQAI